VAWVMDSAYEKYFSTGAYSLRYPGPNFRVLSLILHHARDSTSVLDFGCGNGRYIFPLLASTSASITAYDISQAALRELSARVPDVKLRSRLQIIDGSQSQLESLGSFDLIICMFGALSHISPRSERISTLAFFAKALSASKGKLIISVPNAHRRFLWEQMVPLTEKDVDTKDVPLLKEPGDIYYYRNLSEERILMRYHLYTIASFKADLAEVGLKLDRIVAESILPESAVTRNKIIGSLDKFASQLLPASAGYGLLAIATG
jgi:tRNA (uracil-5-)-methyltransferase TRM9